MSARQYDDNGYYEIKGNPLSRVGVFPYLGRQLGLTGDDATKVYRVYRPAEELGHPDCVNSFRLMPIIDEHTMLGPKAMQESPTAMPAESKGVHGVIGDEVYYKDGWLRGNLKMFSNFLQAKVDAGVRELSAGYRCIYEMVGGAFEGQPYDAIQRQIRGNHVALVPEGRMGPEVAVMDQTFTFTFDLKDAIMADPKDNAPPAKKALSLEEITATLGEIGPQLAALNEAVAKIGVKAPPADTDVVVDGKPGEPSDGKPPVHPAVAADKETAAAIAGMDAAIKTMAASVTALAGTVQAIKDGGNKSAIGEIAQRDGLVKRLAPHIGTFDAADKTLQEVAVYGVEKLKLTTPKGSELIALDAYLTNRPVESTVRMADAMDAAPATPGAFVSKFLATADAE